MESIGIQYLMDLRDVGANTHSPQAAASDIERFQQSMEGPTVNGIDKSAAPDSLFSPAVSHSPGDKVLEGLQRLKSGYEHQFDAVEASLQKTDPLTLNEMMKIQLDLAKLTLQGELINKTVSKSTQNIDTLLKSQ